jgi:hypothetical protein
MGVTLGTTAIICTALRRPDYLKQTLASWQAARGIGEIHSFTLALGYAPEQFMPTLNAFDRFRKGTGLDRRAKVKMDSAEARASRGMHRAIAEAADHVLRDPAVEFLIFGEEDLIVSSDVLEYFMWARELLAGDERILAACSHSPGAQGWDAGAPADRDADADPETARLLPYFQAWVWATSRDQWEKALRPQWDLDCNSGGPMTSGWDWCIATRILPQGNYLCVVPDASRSQNIGRDGGWAARPENFPNTQAASFRAERSRVTYRLAEAERSAAL